MEIVLSDLTEANAEVEKSKATLETLVNDLVVLSGTIAERMVQELRNLRETRQAIGRETTEILHALHDVRKFFLEEEYRIEMERLERFVGLCQKLKAFRDDGFLDQISDVILKLAEGRSRP